MKAFSVGAGGFDECKAYYVVNVNSKIGQSTLINSIIRRVFLL
jgi:hypothetical protein